MTIGGDKKQSTRWHDARPFAQHDVWAALDVCQASPPAPRPALLSTTNPRPTFQQLPLASLRWPASVGFMRQFVLYPNTQLSTRLANPRSAREIQFFAISSPCTNFIYGRPPLTPLLFSPVFCKSVHLGLGLGLLLAAPSSCWQTHKDLERVINHPLQSSQCANHHLRYHVISKRGLKRGRHSTLTILTARPFQRPMKPILA